MQQDLLHFRNITEVRVCHLQQKMFVLATSTFLQVPVPVPSTRLNESDFYNTQKRKSLVNCKQGNCDPPKSQIVPNNRIINVAALGDLVQTH